MSKSDKSRQVKIKSALKYLSFDDLTLFESIARHESLAAAARELGLRSPYVTKTLQKIESAVGFALLKRTSQGTALTPEGAGFLKLCLGVSEAIDRNEWMGPLSAGAPARILTLLGPTFLLNHLVAAYVPKSLKHLNLGLRLIDLGIEEVTSSTYREHFEAALHYEKLGWSDAWKTYPIGTASWVLCARKDHPLGTRVTEKEVLQFPFVVPLLASRQGFRSGDDQCPVPVQRRLRSSEVGTGDIGLQIVERTDQLIFVPEIQARNRVRDGKIKIIEVMDWSPVRKTVFFTVHQDRVTQKIAQGLLSALEGGLIPNRS